MWVLCECGDQKVAFNRYFFFQFSLRGVLRGSGDLTKAWQSRSLPTKLFQKP